MEIKNCPFCNSKAILTSNWELQGKPKNWLSGYEKQFVRCKNRNCSATIELATQLKSILAWNKRDNKGKYK